MNLQPLFETLKPYRFILDTNGQIRLNVVDWAESGPYPYCPLRAYMIVKYDNRGRPRTWQEFDLFDSPEEFETFVTSADGTTKSPYFSASLRQALIDNLLQAGELSDR